MEKEIGEKRIISFHGAGISAASEISFSKVTAACENPDKVSRIWSLQLPLSYIINFFNLLLVLSVFSWEVSHCHFAILELTCDTTYKNPLSNKYRWWHFFSVVNAAHMKSMQGFRRIRRGPPLFHGAFWIINLESLQKEHLVNLWNPLLKPSLNNICEGCRLQKLSV